MGAGRKMAGKSLGLIAELDMREAPMSDQMGQWNGQGNYGGAPSSGWWTPDEQVGGSQQYQGAPGQPYQSGYQAPGAAQQPYSQPYQQPYQPYQQPYQPYQQPVQGAYPQPMPVSAAVGAARRENVALGLLGAFLGSLVGAVLIVVLSRIGVVAALSGIVMSLAALKGYEKFAGGISGLGIALTCLIIVAMVFAADWVDWAIVAAREFDISFFEALQILPDLFDLGAIDSSEYGSNLGMLYAFTALGAAPVIIDCFKNRRA